MAIYITDKDGNDQHFDTIEEFERAMIFMARLGGNNPPQDLIDEVKESSKTEGLKPVVSEALEKERLTDFVVGKAKDGGMHEIVLAQGEPITFSEIKGDEISVGDYVVAKKDSHYMYTDSDALCKVIEIGKDSDEFKGEIIEHKTMPSEVGEEYRFLELVDFEKLSDNEEEARELFNKECDKEDKSTELKFKVGDRVKVVNNSTYGFEEGTFATVFEIDTKDKDTPYIVKAEDDYFYHRESDLELVEDDEETEFYAGDIVYVTKTIDGAIMSKGDIEEGLAEIVNGMVFENSLIRQGSNWGNFKTDNIDHRDKVRLVCQSEDREDK